MTKNIVIKNPSQKLIHLFDTLRERKQKHIKELSEKKQVTFTIIV